MPVYLGPAQYIVGDDGKLYAPGQNVPLAAAEVQDMEARGHLFEDTHKMDVSAYRAALGLPLAPSSQIDAVLTDENFQRGDLVPFLEKHAPDLDSRGEARRQDKLQDVMDKANAEAVKVNQEAAKK